MLPPQLPKVYLAGTQRVHDLLVQLAATLRDSYLQFWANPPTEAVDLNAQSIAAGMTSSEVFAMHFQLLTALSTIVPDRLAWIGTGPPIAVPFDANGSIDIPALSTAWAAYQATLPPAEPEAPVEP